MQGSVSSARWFTALVLNALVLPGSGHIFLGRRALGYAIAIPVISLIVTPLVLYALSTMEALSKLSSPGMPGMKLGLTSLHQAWTAEKGTIGLCILGIVGLWLYGIVDLCWWKKRCGGGVP